MKEIFNVIMGFFYIIGDLLKQLVLIIVGSVTMFFTENRKNNAFLRMLGQNCFLNLFVTGFILFWLIGHISVIAGLVAVILWFFIFTEIRKYLYFKYVNENEYTDEYDILGRFSLGVTLFLTILVSNINSAYKYQEVGSYAFKKSDFVGKKTEQFTVEEESGESVKKSRTVPYYYIKNTMVLDGQEKKVYVKGCKDAGKYKILEETLPVTYIPGVKYAYTSFYAECSSMYQKYKNIEKKIK